MSTGQIIAIRCCLYLIVACIAALIYLRRAEKQEFRLHLERDEIFYCATWPLTILFWFVTKIHNLVHKDRR